MPGDGATPTLHPPSGQQDGAEHTREPWEVSEMPANPRMLRYCSLLALTSLVPFVNGVLNLVSYIRLLAGNEPLSDWTMRLGVTLSVAVCVIWGTSAVRWEDGIYSTHQGYDPFGNGNEDRRPVPKKPEKKANKDDGEGPQGKNDASSKATHKTYGGSSADPPVDETSTASAKSGEDGLFCVEIGTAKKDEVVVNSWRCAHNFLPSGLIKNFGGVEAMIRMGVGQCYCKKAA